MVITPVIWLCMIALSTVIVVVPQIVSNKIMHTKKQNCEDIKPFSMAEYLDYIEKTALDILEAQNPIDKTIVLWWGLNGLRLNEDGSLGWISKRKPKPIQPNVFYQPCQTANATLSFDMYQSPQVAINTLQMQAAQQAQNAAIIAALQSCYAVPYPQYIQGGMVGSDSWLYAQNCCQHLIKGAER